MSAAGRALGWFVCLLAVVSALVSVAHGDRAGSAIDPAPFQLGYAQADRLQPAVRVALGPPRETTTTTAPPTTRPATTVAPVTSLPRPSTTAVTTIPSVAPKVLAVGDIADCGLTSDDDVAALLRRAPGAVLTLGDNAFPTGSAADFANCFNPLFGPMRDRIHPTPGNHDYYSPEAAAYFDYFGAAAGNRAEGWYSFDLGTWHLIALNSNCGQLAGGCGPGSPQETWLRADLASNPAVCTLAYWHHPVFSSGQHGNDGRAAALFQALYDAHAEVVLNAHDRLYERFVPQSPSGAADPMHGIREFIVGTGGLGLNSVIAAAPNSETLNNAHHGALAMTLDNGSYSWEFLTTGERIPVDFGSATCHD